MKIFKKLAVAGVFAIASTGVFANNVNNAIDIVGGTTFFGALHTDNFDFTDVFTFNIAGPVVTSASLITIGAGLNNIDFLTADLNGVSLTLSPTGFMETAVTMSELNLAGPLILTVTGHSGAGGGTFASYSGTLNVNAVSPVPEPETYAMLLAGLGIMGMWARRRKSLNVI